MGMLRVARPGRSLLVLLTALSGCSGTDGSTGANLGGSTAQAGAPASGGAMAGVSSTGGVAPSGGAGGALAGGGTQNSGGVSSVAGGMVGSGGAVASGGGLVTGGRASGGASPSGGIASTGGSKSSGGATPAAGGAVTGGKSSVGGAATGGAVTGGKTATGGAATGGAATGGTKPTGGANSTGGSTACAVAGATSTTLPTLNVLLSNQYRPVTHAASGSLYGLANDGAPADSLISPTKPFMFTQMAPNGQQLPNGATTPIGDALKVAAAAARAGAKVTIRMPDIYPTFPYGWVSLADWNSRVDTMVTATKNSGATNIYAYEIWNEPNWTWNNPNATGMTFNDAWRSTVQRIKAIDSTTKIMGPSISLWDQAFMNNFLSYCKTNNVLPDIVSWHELGEPEGSHIDTGRPGYIPAHIAAYRILETNLAISKRPISINEYGVIPEEGIPGSMIRYIAHFERQGVESANIAFWHQAGRLSDLLTNRSTANGGWWMYKFYGDMSGTMAMTTPPPTAQTALGLDGIASIDAAAKNVQVVFGGASGNNAVVVQGFASAAFFGCSAHVKAETTPWNGLDTAVTAPTTLFESNYPIAGGQLIVAIDNMVANSGYRLTITPN